MPDKLSDQSRQKEREDFLKAIAALEPDVRRALWLHVNSSVPRKGFRLLVGGKGTYRHPEGEKSA